MNQSYGLISHLQSHFLGLLRSCIATRDLITAKTLQTLYIKSIIPDSTYLGNHFIILYSKCRRLAAARAAFDCIPSPNVFSYNAILSAYVKELRYLDARKVFDEMPERDIVSYNIMIAECAERGDAGAAMGLFGRVREEVGVEADGFTFSGLITACCGSVDVIRGLHCLAVVGGFDCYGPVRNSLVTCYGRSGWLEEAERVFEATKGVDDKVAWNAMVVVYGQNKEGSRALELFREMVKQGMDIDMYTLASVLTAFTSLENMTGGVQFHGQLIKMGFRQNAHVGSSLIDLYAKCGDRITNCKRLFEEIPEPDLVVWNTMIFAYSQYEDSWEDAVTCFREMQRRGHWPDDCSFVCVISGCSNSSSPSQGKQIHSLVVKSYIPSNKVSVDNALVSMYAKCGNLQDAGKLFERMPERNTVSVNTMIAGYAQHGFGEEALNLFERMLRTSLIPNNVSFLAVLTACSHTGKFKEGERYFSMMTEELKIKPEVEHYSSIIDMLGRAGKLREAEHLIETMPFDPGSIGWAALLGACRKHGNIELAVKAANRCIEIEPSNAAPYVILSNIYTNAGRWEEVSAVRRLMKEKGVSKKPGCSWIEVNKKIHVFVADDVSHPMIKEISEYLDEMLRKIKRIGYVPDTRWALLKEEGMREAEKESILAHHSEKLAVAFGLLCTGEHETILVMKNLRICGDCHNAIKFVSTVSGREITIRDTHRFHSFKDGKCSCGDYW